MEVTKRQIVINYVFAATDKPIFSASTSFIAMTEACKEHFLVALESDDELKMLMKLLGIDFFVEVPILSSADFFSVFDFSEAKLPQLSEKDFDEIYDEWLRRSGRQTSMDEYGQLVFLRGRGDSWNAKTNRFVLREKV